MAKQRRPSKPAKGKKAVASLDPGGAIRLEPLNHLRAARSHPPRRSTYVEAVALYERGLATLQRHDYNGAADLFESVLRQYPEEKELHERVRLYLNICQRQATPREAAPQTIDERLYAVDARDQRRPLRRGDHAPASGARRGSRQRPRALHAGRRARAARRARGSGRAPRARHRAQPGKPRRRAARSRSRTAPRRRLVPLRPRIDGLPGATPTAAPIVTIIGRNRAIIVLGVERAHRRPCRRQRDADEVGAAQGAAPRRRHCR